MNIPDETPEIVIPTKAEANEVIAWMLDRLNRFGQVTVADFYRLVGINPNYIDESKGWTDLRGVESKEVRDGFIVDLPRPEQFNK